MKPLFPLIISIAAMALLSCGGDEPMSNEEKVSQLLIGSGTSTKVWKMKSVTVDGVDKSTVYSGLILKFSEGQFTATNGEPVWPASGTWSFSSSEATAIKRNDGTEIQVIVTETSLTLTMSWSKTTFEPGRVGSVSGQHKFEMGL
jgi:hypothetical protein